MASKPETTFIQSVHKHLPKTIYRMKNNNPYVGGIFDCWYSGSFTDLWIEYKFVTLPKHGTTFIVHNLSGLQTEWGRERHNEGRNVAVITGCKEGGVLLTDREWETPMSSAEFKTRLQTRPELAAAIDSFTRGEHQCLNQSSPLRGF